MSNRNNIGKNSLRHALAIAEERWPGRPIHVAKRSGGSRFNMGEDVWGLYDLLVLLSGGATVGIQVKTFGSRHEAEARRKISDTIKPLFPFQPIDQWTYAHACWVWSWVRGSGKRPGKMRAWRLDPGSGFWLEEKEPFPSPLSRNGGVGK